MLQQQVVRAFVHQVRHALAGLLQRAQPARLEADAGGRIGQPKRLHRQRLAGDPFHQPAHGHGLQARARLRRHALGHVAPPRVRKDHDAVGAGGQGSGCGVDEGGVRGFDHGVCFGGAGAEAADSGG
jgi:hypothetical protein